MSGNRTGWRHRRYLSGRAGGHPPDPVQLSTWDVALGLALFLVGVVLAIVLIVWPGRSVGRPPAEADAPVW